MIQNNDLDLDNLFFCLCDKDYISFENNSE